MRRQVVKDGSPLFTKLNSIIEFLEQSDMTMFASHNGIVFSLNDKHYRYSMVEEGLNNTEAYADIELPNDIEGRFILCDEFGNAVMVE